MFGRGDNPGGWECTRQHQEHQDEGQFSVDQKQTWCDKNIPSNADGWDGEDKFSGLKAFGLEHAENKRRFSDANWFKLIGVIGDYDDPDDPNHAFAIGTSREGFSPASNGELFTYANDLKQYGLLDLYTNNNGFVDIEVTRTE